MVCIRVIRVDFEYGGQFFYGYYDVVFVIVRVGEFVVEIDLVAIFL